MKCGNKEKGMTLVKQTLKGTHRVELRLEVDVGPQVSSLYAGHSIVILDIFRLNLPRHNVVQQHLHKEGDNQINKVLLN